MLDPKKFIDEKVAWIKAEVGDRKAIAAVSGGVDSTTTAILAHLALGDRLTVVFLDDGLMRDGEPEAVVKLFKRRGMNVNLYDVKSEFFRVLKGITDSEEKRKVFRETFYRVLGQVVKELGAECLLQGTIAADVVETKKGVKTQHNVLEQIGISPKERYGFKVVEPLVDLYKHEVRIVAKALGLPPEVSERRPFPGPGLAVRIIGEVTPERVELVRKATKIVEEETKMIPCFQAFAVLLSDKATGVSENGQRKYGEIVVIRIVNSVDALTAQAVDISWDILKRIRKRILEELPSVVRVLYDITDKPPATIEFE
ncbi:MAG: glutamine-hydrolyzing GMP synthase [Candidatus Bathyarchaeia archaeon]